MTLQQKIISVFLVLGAGFAVAGYSGLQAVIFPAFEDFERDFAVQNLIRAKRAIDAELTALEIVDREYSEWDHTYEFVLGRRDQYVDENLDAAYWKSVDINLLLFFDINGQLVWGTLTDPSMTNDLSIDRELEFDISAGHPLLRHRDDLDGISGLLQTRSGPLLVTANPIVTSAGTGPAVGTLIIGKYMSPARVSEIGQRAAIGFTLYSKNDPSVPPDVGHQLDQSAGPDDMINWEFGENFIKGREVLADIFGDPSFLIEINVPRTITKIGRSAIQSALVLLAAATTIFLLASMIFMRWMIFSPVTMLTRHILWIRKTGDLKQQLNSDRRDEIGTLSSEFDQLALELRTAQEDLEAARDQALALSSAKTEFLARMSHEIRTPMNGVLGMIELLNSTSLNDTQKRYAATIHDSADSLLDIINDVLDFSKIEAGKLRIEKLTFDLHAFVGDTVKSLAGLAKQKGLSLKCDTPPGLALAVRGDPFRLRQVLTNLLGNAIKFTERGSVRLCVAADDLDDGHTNVQFSVVDTGVGISASKQKKIFDSFAQDDGSTTRRYGGTGLGLAISKQLVEMMGGDLRVESEPGHGSVFSFSLRMAASSDSNFSESVRSLQRGIFKRTIEPVVHRSLQGHVLLGEDNAVNQQVAIGMLEAMGVKVTVAKNGKEVAIQFATGSFDAILMDCQMPVMDGYQSTKAIRHLEAENEDEPVPIIAVTANALAGDREKCIAAGMNDYLSKPYTMERLHNVLSKYLVGDAISLQGASDDPTDEVSAPEPRNSTIAIDPGALDELSRIQQGGSGDLVVRVVLAYLESAVKLIAELQSAVESSDADSLRTSAHALKSSSANVGALNLADLCQQMEDKGREENLSDTDILQRRIQQEYERAVAALQLRIEATAA